ncbi:ArsR/SmtB family transcription factor [Wenxinia saemankumensis]|uniref:Transcriptional regulator, ArsR family n=1 Tax=Wenxinia saemankumensis TaxID=1447782 RepID=A0A1M6D4X4_9RHOB|nr:metalloregulator ArsR/SmtB family transcription factor [Wenxinia saemankumensis]SHI68296.1 transcriptional regulator, ArsR family [Wenxinia saemankumensis]
METSDAVAAFSALGQPGRLDVLRHLIQAGPGGRAAGEIAASLGIRPNTLSSALGILSQAGLVSSHRDGRRIVYSARMEAIAALVQWLVADCCGGDAAACAPMTRALTCCPPGRAAP